MKIENTPENKAAFYGQYIGSDLDAIPLNGSSKLTVSNFASVVRHSNVAVSLKPLSEITEEEAMEIALALWPHSEEVGVLLLEARIDFKNRTHNSDFTLWFDGEIIPDPDEEGEYPDGFGPLFVLFVYDFLRSRGFAIPWWDLSVDDLVEYGWVRLTVSQN